MEIVESLRANVASERNPSESQNQIEPEELEGWYTPLPCKVTNIQHQHAT